MSKPQEKAWFMIVGFGANLVAGAVLPVVVPTQDSADVEFLGLGVYQIQGYGIWLAIFCAWIGISDYLYRKRPDDIIDERDEQISQKAKLAAVEVFWLAFGAACAGLVLICGPLRISFPAIWVAGPMVVGGLVVYWGTYSVALLVYYGRHAAREDGGAD